MARSYGAFSETAARFEIANLLTKWCEVGKRGLMISTLTRYMRMVVEVGCAYLLNFSMMRIEECWRLRCDCYQEEDDPNFGKICFLRGSTTKTIQDDDARWITSPAAKIAVDAMASLARLRTRILGPGVGAEFAENDIHNPYLALSAAEPWTAKSWKDSSLSRRHTYPSYLTTVEESPRLFDQDELKITEEDIRICRLVTPDLNTEIYKVGKIWPLAWHQLRRTGAVNMQASGLVSDGSIQYQLKHATRAMSLYYGQGFSHVRLNESARAEYVKVMYEVQGLSIAQLFSDRYVSPYGNAHKTEMLKIVSEKDHKSLCEAAQSGEISWRETLLGGCTKRGPCTYGGIENITRCGGGDGRSPCNFALFDKQKISQMERLASLIELRLAESSRYSPYNDALTAQKTALENALYVTKK
ncbi:hypothetical protein RB24_18150 [Herbaspirillum rubrisubalbicans]|uniref:Integrase n=2 Tax=Herbaspirillum rubrisubalbicans TaxID=80842 RepID=A0ABX9BY94_9BURK|nr:hypothetical protein RB24_18150 [Herbaspirillum rubrisubalbicans]